MHRRAEPLALVPTDVLTNSHFASRQHCVRHSLSVSTSPDRVRRQHACVMRGSSGTRGLMSELMSAFAPELNLDDVIERLVKVTYRIFKVDRVGLFYHHRSSHSLPGDDGAFGAEGASGASTDDRLVMMIAKEGRGLSLPVRGIAGHCATHSAVVNVEDAYQDARFDSTLDRRTGYRTQARKIRFETHRSHRSIDR